MKPREAAKEVFEKWLNKKYAKDAPVGSYSFAARAGATEAYSYLNDFYAMPLDYYKSAYAELKADAQILVDALEFYTDAEHETIALAALSKWNEKYKGD